MTTFPKRFQNQSAFLLQHRPYSETSLLVDLFTEKSGRITAIAKGARRLKSSYRGVLLPFQPLSVLFTGKGDVKTLTGAEPVGSRIILSRDHLMCGFYLNELLIKFLHRHDPHERLFDRYWQCIHELLNQSDQESALRYFEKVLLEEIGYGLQLEYDQTTGETIVPNCRYRYRPGLGAFVEQADDRSGVEIHGESLIALRLESALNHRSQKEVKQLHRVIFSDLLEGRTLVSRSVYSQLYLKEAAATGAASASHTEAH